MSALSSSSQLAYETVASLTGFGLSALSPNGEWFAVASAGRVSIHPVAEPESIAQQLLCVDKIDKMEFSPDSGYLLCAMYSRQAVQVFALKDPQWKCRINESAAGLISAAWAPDSRSILTESDFGIQLSLWGLSSGAQAVISLPKPSTSSKAKHFAFSSCGRFLAVLHRMELTDMVGIYSTLSTPQEVVKWRCRSADVHQIVWLAGGQLLTVDTPLSYRVCVYTPSGELLASYEAYAHALGVRCLAPAPQWIAVGSYDGRVRLLAQGSYEAAFSLPLVHIKDMDPTLLAQGVCTTVEAADGSMDFDATSSSNTSSGVFQHRMLRCLPKASQATQAASSAKGLPAFGVSWLGWSPCEGYLAATEESASRCLWVWDKTAKLVALLVLAAPISCATWHPSSTSSSSPWLVMASGTSWLYFWSPLHGLSRAERPGHAKGFVLTSAVWTASDGSEGTGTGGKAGDSGQHLLLLKAKDSMLLCRLTNEA